MRIIDSNNLDRARWDHMVALTTGGQVFTQSAYLDAVADQWCVYVDEEYTKGIALPYTNKLGQKVLYTPIFLRAVQWLGSENVEGNVMIPILRNEFKGAALNFSGSDGALMYQEILPGQERKLGSQADRMLKKAEKTGFDLSTSTDPMSVMEVIRQELPQKIDSINETSLAALERLVKNMHAMGQLLVIDASLNGVHQGGLLLIRYGGRMLYLKGAFTDEAKKNGAMYFAMDKAIGIADSEGLIFDFGGSRVEGVRRFNHNLGGTDRTYGMLEWDDTPFWYRLLKGMKKFMKR